MIYNLINALYYSFIFYIAYSVLYRVIEIKKYVKKSKVAIAGGINKESAAKYAAINPDVMVVGEGITKSEAPGETTACIKKAMMEA